MPDPIMGVEFAHPRLTSLGLEVLALSDLRRRASPEHFLRPQRPAFHVLLLFRAGTGWHTLDFQTLPCVPGTLVHCRPGQVQQFDIRVGLEATVILFRPDFPLLEPATSELLLVDRILSNGGATFSGPALAALSDDFETLARSHARADASRASTSILQHLLQALLLRLAVLLEGNEPNPHAGTPQHRLFRRFRQLAEARFTDDWRVADYARALALSEKTLTRICTSISGKPPARFVEARLLLEAKRLLVHSDLSSAAVAMQLGFDEPTNFTKFFRRLAGVTPLDFRRSQRTLPGGGQSAFHGQ